MQFGKKRLSDKMRQIISLHTGQTYEKVAKDTDRDYYLNSEEAKEYGLIDDVLGDTAVPSSGKKNKK